MNCVRESTSAGAVARAVRVAYMHLLCGDLVVELALNSIRGRLECLRFCIPHSRDVCDALFYVIVRCSASVTR